MTRLMRRRGELVASDETYEDSETPVTILMSHAR